MVVAQHYQPCQQPGPEGKSQLLCSKQTLSLTLVVQTLILTYVTIPAQSRVNPEALSSPAAFAHYSIREVVLRRFIPARMRD